MQQVEQVAVRQHVGVASVGSPDGLADEAARDRRAPEGAAPREATLRTGQLGEVPGGLVEVVDAEPGDVLAADDGARAVRRQLDAESVGSVDVLASGDRARCPSRQSVIVSLPVLALRAKTTLPLVPETKTYFPEGADVTARAWSRAGPEVPRLSHSSGDRARAVVGDAAARRPGCLRQGASRPSREDGDAVHVGHVEVGSRGRQRELVAVGEQADRVGAAGGDRLGEAAGRSRLDGQRARGQAAVQREEPVLAAHVDVQRVGAHHHCRRR